MLRYLTAGESHGKALVAIVEGLPAGLFVDEADINIELARRQEGVGRGKRMLIEHDTATILCGLRKKKTIGSPVAVCIENRDASIEQLPAVVSPRPGHADLSGLLKYGFTDVRSVLERASARETAARVAVGALCKIFLRQWGIEVSSKVVSIGGESDESAMIKRVNAAAVKKDTLGGVFEVIARKVPAGLGSYAQYDRRLDGRIALAIMSIPGIKAIESGLGFGYADALGSEVHDPIYYSKQKGYYRSSNNAGGIEGGITNGEPVVVRACMKPICTLMEPLDSVNILTKKPHKASVERSDVCAVEAAAVVGESAVAFELASAFLEKFGNDCLSDLKKAYQSYCKRIMK